MATELETARAILAAAPTPTVLELGAHHGNDTVPLYDACQSPAHYVAVEADPRNVPVLTRRVLGRNINVLHAAVWDTCGTIPFHLCNGNANGSSSARAPLKHLDCFPSITFSTVVEVPVLTLDAIANAYNIGPITLIWADLQGAERNMVQGGTYALQRTQWLLTECDRIEMYEGQAVRDELLALLGPTWELVAEWPANANLLLRNLLCT